MWGMKPTFAGGEISPLLGARVDLAKYGTAAQTMRNFIVHPYGGASNRPGTLFVGPAAVLSEATPRLIPFSFNAEQTYVLVFGDSKMRVLKDGGYVLNSDTKTVASVTNGTQTTLEFSTAHGWLDGALVYLTADDTTYPLHNRYFVVGHKAANDFRLHELWGDEVDSSGWASESGITISCTSVYTVDTPYSNANDLSRIAYCQSADTMFLAHPSVPPYKVVRSGHASWAFSRLNFLATQQPPTGLTATYTATPGATTRQIRYKVSAVSESGEESVPSTEALATVDSPWASGARVNLSWTKVTGAVEYNVYKNARGFFGWIGVLPWDIAQVQNVTPISSTEYDAKADAFDGNTATGWSSQNGVTAVSGVAYIGQDFGSAVNITAVRIMQAYQLGNYGVSSVKIQYSSDGSTWNDLAVNGTFSLSIDPSIWQQLSFKENTVSARYWRVLANANITSGNRWIVRELKFFTPGVPTEFTDDYIDEDTSRTPQTEENPFSSAGNYPGAVGIFEQRLFWARTNNQPNTVWASQTGNFTNMGVSSPLRDTDAVEASPATGQMDEILHLIPLKKILVLTAGSEWVMGPGANSDAITPTSVSFETQSYYGARAVAPIVSGTTVLFISRQGDKVRDMFYQLQQEGYDGNNLTLFAEHLFRSSTSATGRRRIVSWAYQKSPDGIIWCCMDDGALLGLTYLREHEIWAWHRHDSGADSASCATATWKSVATISSAEDDYFYAVTQRTIKKADGVTPVTVTYIEMLSPRLPESTMPVFADCAVTAEYSGAGTTTVRGLWHLEGTAVAVLADRCVVNGLTVSGGQITLPFSANKVVVGVPYVADLQTLRVELQGEDGTIQGRRKHISRIVMRLDRSRGGYVGPDASHLTEMKYRTTEAYNSPVALFSGDKELVMAPGWNRDGCIFVRQSDPLPITVLSVIPEVDTGG